MSFTAVHYLIFFCIVFFAVYFIRQITLRNIFLLAASCFFYGWWSIKYLLLMLSISLIAFLSGIALHFIKKNKKNFLYFSIFIVLLPLGYFKYTNFFISIIIDIYSLLHHENRSITVSIILPLSISFLSFQLIAYIVDVYREKTDAEFNIITFLTFSFFFPQFVAGPIERAQYLLPQSCPAKEC